MTSDDEHLVPLSFRPPVRSTRDGIRVDIPADERELIGRLLDELREIVAPSETGDHADDDPVATRLWPTVYPDDPELDAEYQRFMSDELLASRLGAIEQVQTVIEQSSPIFDETGANAFMRSLNTLRLVLGTMLGVTEDDEPEDSPEYQLYAYLSWLLEWTVRAL